VRRTAKRQGLHTDASFRFERGVDPEGVVRAADRAARLMAELAGGTVAPGVVEARGHAAPRCEGLELEATAVDRLLGTEIPEPEIAASLERLGIACEDQGGGRWRCVPPSHRHDIWIPEDLIEEVARIHGYERVPCTPQVAELAEGHRPPEWAPGEHAKDVLRAEGLVEVMTLPFFAPADLDALGLSAEDPRRDTVRLVNPLVEAEDRMRSSLVAPLLRHVAANLNRQLGRVGIFELARTFRLHTPGELPEERTFVAVLLTDDAAPGLWHDADTPLFFVLKAVAERLIGELGYEGRLEPEAPEPYLHPGVSGGLHVAGRRVGALGEVHPQVAARFGIERALVALELDLTALLACPRREVRLQEVSPYPSAARDLAVVLEGSQRAGEVLEAIRRQGGPLLHDVELFDRYEGPGVPEGRVSLAFRLTFQRGDRTLTDAEVNKATDRVVQMLAHRFGGELR